MFSRGNVTAKYRSYLRHAKALKERFRTENVTKLNDNAISRCERVSDKLLQRENNLVTSSSLSQRIKATICSAQDRLTSPSKPQNTKDAERISLAKRLVQKPYFIGAGFLGIGTKPVTIEGYNAYDVEVLTQLGIVSKNDVDVATNINDNSVNASGVDGAINSDGGGDVDSASKGGGGIDGSSSGGGGGINGASNGDIDGTTNVDSGGIDGACRVDSGGDIDSASKGGGGAIDGASNGGGGAIDGAVNLSIGKDGATYDPLTNSNEMTSLHDSITTQLSNIDTTSHPQNLYPKSLSESNYTSIFDNMPPESARNDIFTTLFHNDVFTSIRNAFSTDVKTDEGKKDAVIEAMSQNFTVVKSEGVQRIIPESYRNDVYNTNDVISENDITSEMDVVSKTNVEHDAISVTNFISETNDRNGVTSEINVENDVISEIKDVTSEMSVGNSINVTNDITRTNDILLSKSNDLLSSSTPVQSEYLTPISSNLKSMTQSDIISNNVESLMTFISTKINNVEPTMNNFVDSVTTKASSFIELFSSNPASSTLPQSTNDASVPQQLTVGSSRGDHSEVLSSNDAINFSPVDSSIVVEAIPEPPVIPDAALEIASQTNALGEATFASLGLGGWTPAGIVQNCFEYLHVTLGIPWWEAIAIGTIIIRFCMFPLVIISQRNAAKMNNHLPQLQVLQLKMTEARQTGNQMEVARYSQEMMSFMKEKQLNPFKNMIVPLAQMPIFISFFVGLRQMANVPVDSLRTGGMLWFTDLTVPDQFFALPVITSFTLWATIELGTDSARLSSQNMQTMKYVLRALPVVILPFTINFPGAILCYWAASNFISLAQVGFLKIPAVRDYFKIDPLIRHDPDKLPVKNKGFVGGIKESWTNIKITKELEERRRLDDLQFQRAGKGPLVKTYKYDPTKQGPTISAKNR